MPQVTYFNPSGLSVAVSINNGQLFSITGANNNQPGSQVGNFGSFPSPGNLGTGQNMVSITPSGVIVPTSFAINIPGNIPFISLQIYFFYNNYGQLAWTLLNNGELVTTGHVSGQI